MFFLNIFSQIATLITQNIICLRLPAYEIYV